MARCLVSFLDTEGLRHTVEVDADSLYEAAVRAMRVFTRNECRPGPASRLDVEVCSSVTHSLTVKKLYDWLNGGASSPREALKKKELRDLL